MKKSMKKIISILMAVLMLVPVVSIVSSAKDILYTTTIPTVYLTGQGTLLWDHPGTNRDEAFYPLQIPDGYIGDAGKGLIAPLLTGIATDNWDEYCDKLSEAIIGIVGVLGLDKNGEAQPGTHSWPVSPNKNIKTDDGRYSFYSPTNNGAGYYFNYDWRTDPYAIADDLNDFIEGVKAKNEVEKVNLVGRCLGVNVILTYLSEYGNDSVEKTVLVSGGFDGFASIDALFTGNYVFDADALTRFADGYITTSEDLEDPVYGLIDVIVRLLNQAKALGMPVELVSKFWSKVSDNVTPRVLLASYASMPSFWAFVSDDCYDEAKSFIFEGKEEEYAGLIEKIDRYRYDVGAKYAEIIDDANAAGNQVSIVAKYGLQMIPIIEESDIMADQFLDTSSSSFGATCSTIDGKLSKEYLAAAKENGTDRFISADSQIDASTCRYPERTWFIKNMAHMDIPDCINDLLCTILDFDGDMTVFDDEALPQFLYCKGTGAEAELAPLTKENASGNSKTEIFKDYRLNSLVDLLISLVKTFLFYVEKLLGR